MTVASLHEAFVGARDRPLFVSDAGTISYREWLELVVQAPIADVQAGDVVGLRIAPGADSIAMLWALLQRRAIVGLIGPHEDLEQAAQRMQAQWIGDCE
ncbi:MAG TPA: hypothetical protein VFX59_12830, partial [Polyangiales bacterium]|nr:hypothetical protein [Polyangiales bacterium]